jgi:hypothetical protein
MAIAVFIISAADSDRVSYLPWVDCEARLVAAIHIAEVITDKGMRLRRIHLLPKYIALSLI